MKPFEVGKTYKNKAGKDVRIVCVDKKGVSPIIGLMESSNGMEESAMTFRADGKYVNRPSEYDLIPEKETHTVWINVYPADEFSSRYYANESKEKADQAAGTARIACISVIFEIP